MPRTLIRQGALPIALSLSSARAKFQLLISGLCAIANKFCGEVDEARDGKGLGLISMKERAHLVNGSFAIESAPGGGTRIMVCVPLPGNQTAGANGEQLDREAAVTTEVSEEVVP
jgi:signal transduction histidine kinase